MQDSDFHDMMASAYGAQVNNNARYNESVISCRLQEGRADKLRRYCKKHGVSVNAVLNEIIRRFLSSTEQ